MDSHRTLQESRFAVLVEKLNPSQLNDRVFRVFDAVHESLDCLAIGASKTSAPRTAAPIRPFSRLICMLVVDEPPGLYRDAMPLASDLSDNRH